jgi:hypothetical protein
MLSEYGHPTPSKIIIQGTKSSEPTGSGQRSFKKAVNLGNIQPIYFAMSVGTYLERTSELVQQLP